MRRKRRPVERTFMKAIGSVGGREANLKRRRALVRKLMEQYQNESKDRLGH